MPFTTLEKITPFTHTGVVTYLGGNEGANFTAIEEQAAIVIRDITGRTVPADVDDAPDWIHLPAAYIITKLCAPKLKELSLEAFNRIEDDYKMALKMLSEHPKLDTNGDPELQDRSTSKTGTIKNTYSW